MIFVLEPELCVIIEIIQRFEQEEEVTILFPVWDRWNQQTFNLNYYENIERFYYLFSEEMFLEMSHQQLFAKSVEMNRGL